MAIYGIYNLDTLEKLVDILLKMHQKTTWNEKLFWGKFNDWYQWYLTKEGVPTLCHKFSFVHNYNYRKISQNV